MVDNVVGMLIGAAIDRQDGDSGIGGAIGGYIAQAVIKVAAPLIVTFAIGWGVQYLARRAVQTVSGETVEARG